MGTLGGAGSGRSAKCTARTITVENSNVSAAAETKRIGRTRIFWRSITLTNRVRDGAAAWNNQITNTLGAGSLAPRNGWKLDR